MGRTDAVHLALMLLALGLAYLVPFELLLLAYAVLGPAHYTTEISWLHDRKYFVPQRGFALALATIAVAAAFYVASDAWFGFVLWRAFAGAALLAAPRTTPQRIGLAIAAVGVTLVFVARLPALATLSILLPTLIHVSLFTLIFMALGAYRSGSAAQGLLVAMYLAAIALLLLVPPTAHTVLPRVDELGRLYFGNVAPALGQVFGVPGLQLDARLTGLFGFIYAYHYLNWFIKVEVIRWADMPRWRWAAIGVISAASTGLYFHDYALAFSVLYGLSLAHVVLEFPLNAVAARQLADAIGRSAVRLVAPTRTQTMRLRSARR